MAREVVQVALPPGGDAAREVLTHSFEASDGARIAYHECGEGVPLVMIHGLGQSSRVFGSQIRVFSKAFRVIALDHRGHGASEDAGYGYRVSRLAADVHDLLELLGIGSACFLCHSLGCSVFFNYVDLFGCARVRRLVLVDQPPVFRSERWWELAGERGREPMLASDFASAACLLEFFGKCGDPEMLEALVRYMVSPNITPTHLELLLRENAITPPHWKQSLLLSNRFQDYRDVLGRIACPTLLVGAEGSFVEPGVLEAMRREMPSAKIRIFGEEPGSSHFMFLELASKFNKCVWSFLRSDSENFTNDCTREET